MVNGSLQCCRFDPHLLALGLFRLGGAMSEGSILGSGQRAAWGRGDREKRYRQRGEYRERMGRGKQMTRHKDHDMEAVHVVQPLSMVSGFVKCAAPAGRIGNPSRRALLAPVLGSPKGRVVANSRGSDPWQTAAPWRKAGRRRAIGSSIWRGNIAG